MINSGELWRNVARAMRGIMPREELNDDLLSNNLAAPGES
ncbi:hypothetical protein SAMN02745866_00417 [Alteromonadaceae bacterium Bs31]|nr:hypothetical protein SAMN02745866_00417 [Alteromonadaceae bacterium Bs31]